MRDETQDLRVKKTKRAIISKFYEMILEMDLSDITIKELCARAEISRKTFYNHYPDIESLIVDFQQQLFQYMVDEIGLPYKQKDGPGFYHDAVMFFAKNADLSCKLYSNFHYRALLDNFIATSKAKLDFGSFVPGTKHPDLAAAFMANSLHSIVYEWYRNGKKQSLEELADYATSMVYRGISSSKCSR